MPDTKFFFILIYDDKYIDKKVVISIRDDEIVYKVAEKRVR
jgi:hypothetical protein